MSNKSENIIMVGDFNLTHVDWVSRFVVSPLISISHHFRIQNEYLDLFTMKGLLGFIDEYTRCKLVGNR